jgi:nucleotide-binding universal stress UspA family protein
MYRRILLAYDGSVGGRTALREGALLARQCGAEVFLLSGLADNNTFLLTEVALAGVSVQMEDDLMDILNEGVARLRKAASIASSLTALRATSRLHSE